MLLTHGAVGRRLRRRRVGFTLIELLVVVAIIGIVTTILIPNLLDSLQKSKQKRTVADMREVGIAWLSWLTDQVSAASAGNPQKFDFDGSFSTSLTAAKLLDDFYVDEDMFYARQVPDKDGWGHDFDYWWSGNPLVTPVLGIRSRGRDGQVGPSANPYTLGPFVATNYDEDIVWSDGLFVRFPSGVVSQ